MYRSNFDLIGWLNSQMPEHTSSIYLDPLSRRNSFHENCDIRVWVLFLSRGNCEGTCSPPSDKLSFSTENTKNIYIFFLQNTNTLCFNKERIPSAPITHLHINKLTNQQLRGLYWLTQWLYHSPNGLNHYRFKGEMVPNLVKYQKCTEKCKQVKITHSNHRSYK